MLTFLFWNMGGARTTDDALARQRQARLSTIVANLARRFRVDLLILAECPVAAPDLLEAVNAESLNPFSSPDPLSVCERIAVYPRFPGRFLKLKSEWTKYTGRELRLPGSPSILLFAVHLGSKLHQSGESQGMSLPDFRGTIRMVERQSGHERTVLVGDLNMNPFETGIVDAHGLNAVMTRKLASRGARTVDAVAYPFFYNPMWSCFGDSTHETHPPGSQAHEPPGTCYYPASESKWYYWNMFDQVLLRPALLPYFRNQDLKILVSDGATSLLTKEGLPNRKLASDHLPLLFQLAL